MTDRLIACARCGDTRPHSLTGWCQRCGFEGFTAVAEGTRELPKQPVDPKVERVAMAIHAGLGGNGWAYSNADGNELESMRDALIAAAKAAILAM